MCVCNRKHEFEMNKKQTKPKIIVFWKSDFFTSTVVYQEIRNPEGVV